MKNLITFFILFCFCSKVQASTYTYRDSIVNYAKSFLGVPYNYGGTSKKGFDCSGFIYYVFKQFNRSVPRVSSAYNSFGEAQELLNCKPADIIVFTGTNSSIRKPGHLGLVLKNADGNIDFIHASSSKKHYGVTITRYNSSNYVKRFLKVISVIND